MIQLLTQTEPTVDFETGGTYAFRTTVGDVCLLTKYAAPSIQPKGITQICIKGEDPNVIKWTLDNMRRTSGIPNDFTYSQVENEEAQTIAFGFEWWEVTVV